MTKREVEIHLAGDIPAPVKARVIVKHTRMQNARHWLATWLIRLSLWIGGLDVILAHDVEEQNAQSGFSNQSDRERSGA
jgi:hypothetical protein